MLAEMVLVRPSAKAWPICSELWMVLIALREVSTASLAIPEIVASEIFFIPSLGRTRLVSLAKSVSSF